MGEVYDWSSFVELRGFFTRWEGCGCTERDLRDFQMELAADPLKWPVVPTAGGWRKARFAPPAWGKGKSGAVRVYFADLSRFGRFVLGIAFTKAEMPDLSAAGKRYMAQRLAEIIRDLEADQ